MPTTKKPTIPRLTIAYSNKRGVLEPILKEQRKAFPKANVKLVGRPGEWKVRRDLQEGEDQAAHRARDLRRFV